MAWLFKKKEKELQIGDLYAYLPDLLEEKKKHLDTLRSLQQRLIKKGSDTNNLLIHVHDVIQKADQQLIYNKSNINDKRREMALADGNTRAEEYEKKIKELREDSLRHFKISELYGEIAQILSEKTAEMKKVKDPLQRSINRMEVEVNESERLMENINTKEISYFKRVNKIEKFEELVPAFKSRKQEDDKLIEALKSLISFSSDPKEIGNQLTIFRLNEAQISKFEKEHVG